MSVDLLLFALLPLLPVKAARMVILAAFIPLLLLSVASIVHIAIYGSAVSSLSVLSTLETSANEALEFFSEFAAMPNILIVVLVIGAAVLLMRKALAANARIARTRAARVVPLLILCASVSGVAVKGQRLLNSNTSYVIVHSVANYNRDMRLVEELRAGRSEKIYSGIQVLGADAAAGKTCIFVIGESANRNHMSAYGYERNTTPQLEKLAEAMYVFTDVVSASTHTIPSLRQALFFHNDTPVDSVRILESHSIVGLLARAGFETWWLSNQTANSDGLTGTALFAADAHHRVFLNKSRSEGHSISYDQVLLDKLDEALQAKSERKAIFMHLLGSHLSYHLRYPGEFAAFSSVADIPSAPHRTQADKNYINQYDNSILYTDYILSRILALAKEQDDTSVIVYFSDHGQEVYDTLPIRGQDAKRPTRNMFDVPFIVWMSEKYKAANAELVRRVAERVKTPFSLSRFAETAADLAGVRFDGMLAGRSFFAEEHRPPAKREIPYGRDYDSLATLRH